MKLILEGGLEEGVEGYTTQQDMLGIFETALSLQRQKASTYGEAFRSQGYMGNVARVLSKVSRLRNMVWRDDQFEDSLESIEDTMLDLINLSAFFLINRRIRNKWGNRV